MRALPWAGLFQPFRLKSGRPFAADGWFNLAHQYRDEAGLGFSSAHHEALIDLVRQQLEEAREETDAAIDALVAERLGVLASLV
jgi:hypothetical protein